VPAIARYAPPSPASAPVASGIAAGGDDADPGRVECLRLLPRRAEVQADVRRAEDPREQDGEREAQVDEERLAEERKLAVDRLAEHRDPVEQGNRSGVDASEPRLRGAELRLIEDARDPFAGERDRDPDDDLIEAEPDAEHDHEARGEHPGAHPAEVAEPHRVAVVRAEEADVRSHEHHPLQADVEYTGALGDRLAERREHQRHAGEKPSGEHARPEHLRPDLARDDHDDRLRASGERSACLSPGVR
jgi:hypothetical protein